jgi:hypothetical protein
MLFVGFGGGVGVLSISCILEAIVKLLKVNVDWLGGINGVVQAAFAVFDVRWSYLAITTK